MGLKTRIAFFILKNFLSLEHFVYSKLVLGIEEEKFLLF